MFLKVISSLFSHNQEIKCRYYCSCRLPEVKKFLFDDLEAKFYNTEFKKVPGKSPTMMFFDKVHFQFLIHSACEFA